MDESTAINFVRSYRGEYPGKSRIAFVSGNFNVVHPGHLRILKFAKDNADFLVVGVNPDYTKGVSLARDLRLESLAAITLIDLVVALEDEPEEFIQQLQPEIVVKGKEFEKRKNSEQAVIDTYGGKLIFGGGEMRFSSINLLQKEYYETNFATIKKPVDFPARHNFEISDLKHALAKISKLRVLVIGDLIVDTYVECDPVGMSQEDPTIVVSPIEEKSFVGGAGIVAAHARSLGAEVRFLTVSGSDEQSIFAQEKLAAYGVHSNLFFDTTRPTTHKTRYRALGKTLLRVNKMRQHAIAPDIISRMLEMISQQLPNTDIILFADFNYGCLPQSLVDEIISMAKARNIMMAADSQASSQLSDISRFKDMILITPTEREARLALRDQDSGLVVLCENLRDTARAKNVFVTLGSEGLLIHGQNDKEHMTDRLPAFNMNAKDVSGAGDSLFTSSALAYAAGTDIWQSAYLGAMAAGCQVSRVGNTPLTLEDILTEMEYPTS